VDQTDEQGPGRVQDVPIPGSVPAPPSVQELAAVPSQPAAAPEQPAAAPEQPPGRISPRRALGEIGTVYFVSFGLGVISAIGLLTDPSLSADQQIRTWLEAGSEMMQYIMQASVVVLGVGYFSLRRGLTLRSIFGRFTKRTPPVMYYPPQYPAQYAYPYSTQPYASGYPAYQAYPQMGYAPNRPAERGPGWQFARAFFLSMAGVLAFLVTVVVYINVTGRSTGAPDQGNSLWMVPVGIVVALAAGLGEEVLITGMVVTTLEQAGFASRAWVIYLVAVALRVPFHLYYGWASLGVICFTVVNVWVYRRWRLLWPIVLAHAAYDAVEFAGSLVPQLAGLALLGLGLATFVMVIVIACIELSDRSARRRFNQWRAAVGV
jgi:membrane protease YdiL (CAAX protease family)